MVNLFLVLQHMAMVSFIGTGTPNYMTKINLEWDETGQTMRLRRGLVQVEGVMPVLVSWALQTSGIEKTTKKL